MITGNAAPVPASPIRQKPPHGEPCNHCGQCCTRSLCWVGREILGPDAKAPCPALIDCGSEMFCGLMARPQDYRPEQAKAVGIEPMRKAAQMLIGAGTGCALKYDSEPRNPHFKGGLGRLSHKKIIKELKVWGLSRGQSIAFLRKWGL